MATPPPPPSAPATPPPPHGSDTRTAFPPGRRASGEAPSPGTSEAGGSASGVTDADLRVLETELAKHVGPLARVLVKRAAKGAGNMSHVITKLELEIDSDDARRAFRAAVRNFR
jgi:serine/threonine-protein kinase